MLRLLARIVIFTMILTAPPVLHRGQMSGLQAGLQEPATDPGKPPCCHQPGNRCPNTAPATCSIHNRLHYLPCPVTCCSIQISSLTASAWSSPTPAHLPRIL